MKSISRWLILPLLVGAFGVQATAYGIYGLPKTGQTSIYHPSSSPYDPGDDGCLRVGYPLTGSRFQDNGNGTVTDLSTGLMWQKSDSASQAFGGVSGALSWQNSFSYTAAMNQYKYAGQDDWRVPNIKELLSIFNLGTFMTASHSVFPDIRTGALYWSASSYAASQSHFVFSVHADDGILWFSPEADTTYPHYVKAVRSASAEPGLRGMPKTGQTLIFHQAGGYDLGDDGAVQAGYPSPAYGADFVDQGNETILQRSTNLLWQEQDSSLQGFGGLEGGLPWEEAFSYVEEMNRSKFAGFSDWRLPNYFEFAGMLDLSQAYPVFNPLFQGANPIGYYWTSSSCFNRGFPNNGWAIEGASGFGTFRPKTDSYYIRAVRGGAYLPLPTPPLEPTPSPVPGTVRGLPKTGQTAVFHPASGYDQGDDGARQFGYPLSGSRFVDNGSTISDFATGLMWQQDESSSHAFGGYSGALSWEAGFAYVKAMNNAGFGGYSDWRMPNIKELHSTVQHGTHRPAISSLFTGTQWSNDALGYWGSTSHADVINGRHVYQVHFKEGYMLFPDMAENPFGYVRAVRSQAPASGTLGFPRSGQTVIYHWPSGNDRGDDGAVQAGYPAAGARFADGLDGTVRDLATGLVWQKTDSVYHPLGEYRDRMNWEDSFAYVRKLNEQAYGGHAGWRLPNVAEMISLADYSQYCSALDPLLQNYSQSNFYWTGTTRCVVSEQAWAVHVGNGFTSFTDKAGGRFFVRAVLGGPLYSPPPLPITPTPTPVGYHSPTPDGDVTPTPPAVVPTPPYNLYYGLPKTGQTTVFHDGGAYDLGDDACSRIGYPVQSGRFEDLGNGALLDWATGLMWQKSESNHQPFGGLSGLLSWEETFQYVKAMNQSSFGGYSDWRVPNAKELLSTRDLEREMSVNPAFSPTNDDDFWSSTRSPNFTSDTGVFYLRYSWGYLLAHPLDQAPPRKCAVRAVRSFYRGSDALGFPKTGQAIPTHPAGPYDLGDDGANQAGYPSAGVRFIDHGNGTVTDAATGLTWQQGWSSSPRDWLGAFAYVRDELNELHFGGGTDWRVPNCMELASLVDYGRYHPCLDPIFGGSPPALFWSSNTCKKWTANAWAVSMDFGYVEQLPKTYLYYVRAVRGSGQSGPRPSPTPDAYSSPLVLESGDYDGDGSSDCALYRPSSGMWSVRNVTRFYLGRDGDLPISGDYDGDGSTDAGIFRGGNGLWRIAGLSAFYFGSGEDLTVPADYDGDGSCDAGIYRAGSSLWVVRNLTRAYLGASGDRPVPGDYGGEGQARPALFRPPAGMWYIRDFSRFFFGGTGDLPVNGDYDGDGKTDAGIYRPSRGFWAIRATTHAYLGGPDDLPVPALYRAGGVDTIGIFRKSSGLWVVRGLTRLYFGCSEDIPVTR